MHRAENCVNLLPKRPLLNFGSYISPVTDPVFSAVGYQLALQLQCVIFIHFSSLRESKLSALPPVGSSFKFSKNITLVHSRFLTHMLNRCSEDTSPQNIQA